MLWSAAVVRNFGCDEETDNNKSRSLLLSNSKDREKEAKMTTSFLPSSLFPLVQILGTALTHHTPTLAHETGTGL